MKFLFLTREDCAGVAHKLKAAADSLDGHSARSVSTFRSNLLYDVDILRPGAEDLNDLREWADAIVMFDGWPRTAETETGKPLGVVYSGTSYRNHWRDRNEQDSASGIVQFGTTIDMTCKIYGSKLAWLPVPVPWVGRKSEEGDKFHVFHSPARPSRKGTSKIIEEISRIDGACLEVVVGMSNEECLERKARADLCVDQFNMGYGVNALEAWALGMPVIANNAGMPKEYEVVAPSQKEMTERAFSLTGMDRLPFARADIKKKGDLRRVVTTMSKHKEFYRRERKVGVDYLRRFHSPGHVIGRLVSALEKGA